MKKIQSKVSVSRGGKVLGEYTALQMPSLYETGHLAEDDSCLDAASNEWIPLKDFLQRVPGYSPRSRPAAENEGAKVRVRTIHRPSAAWLLTFVALALAFCLGLLTWKQREEITGLHARLSATEATLAEAKDKYLKILFASREVASSDLVRGRVILRDPSGKRISLPGIKIRIYPRSRIEAHLAERHASVAQAGGTDSIRLANHFLKNLPDPLETTSTDSDGRFQLNVPEPGEYVLQTSIRSAKSGEMRVWFVAFDSRDPLNTPVDITESNVVQQFNPLLMLVDGR